MELEASCVADQASEISSHVLPLSSEEACPLASVHPLVSVAAEASAAAATRLLKMMRTMAEQTVASCILSSVPCIPPKDNKASNIKDEQHYIHINVPTYINRNMSFKTSVVQKSQK